ncbi:MAG TPA: RHS repeat-associated core domain-containing protein, partial [Thermoanaerobaculia bacterium]
MIEHIRTLYRKDDLTAFSPLGTVEPLALPGESYKLALTPGLLSHVFKRKRPGQPDEDLLPGPAALLEGKGDDQGGYAAIDGNWWIPSGRTFFDLAADIADPALTAAQERNTARQHFYLPRKIADPFGQSTRLEYDAHDLLLARTSDALGNAVTGVNDYRVLQPRLITDPNNNRTAVAFDALGLLVATAVMGKAGENDGDLLEGFDPDPSPADLQAFFADPRARAASLLGKATSRVVYDLERFQHTGQPPAAATLARETHFHAPGGAKTAIQISFSYSDGFEREIQKKIQAEAGGAAQRWVGTGRTVFNNKGKPVRQYEPFFSATHLYEPEREMTDTGVSRVLFYDPLDRVVATLHPNHTYMKVVFNPWSHTTFDVNDTVAARGLETGDPRTDRDIAGYVREYFKTQPANWQTWHAQRIGNQMGAAERDAAQKAAVHADTPIVAHLDALGRPFLTVGHNRFERNGAEVEEKNATRVELDIEGNQRAVSDARDRVVMRYNYDLLGNRIHQASMEAGERWTLNDAGGKPIRAWDSGGFLRRLTYDELRRPAGLFVTEKGAERLAELTVYGEPQGDAGNHRTRAHQVFDGAGIVTSVAYDFKGNLLESRRDLLPGYRQEVDWLTDPAADDGSFTSKNTYDALDRPLTATSPDKSVYRATFNEANLLDKVEVDLRGAASTPFVTNIDYDAKGRRKKIVYGNGVQTSYEYDPLTFRLTSLKTTRPADPDVTASQLFQNVALVQDLRYTYDPVGNLTRVEDAALKTVIHGGQQVDPVSRYTYDALYRLIEAQGREHIGQTAFDFNPPDGDYRDQPFVGHRVNPNDLEALRNYTQRYEYDAAGNFKVLRHLAAGANWTRGYEYEEESLLEAGKQSNRLTRTKIGNGISRTEPYTHDAHGNITSMPHLAALAWDFEDQLRQVDLGGGGTAYYVYDAAGQRVRKVIDDQHGARRTERIDLGSFEIYREYKAGAVDLERESLHVMDDQQRIALVDTQTVENGNPVDPPVSLPRYQIGNPLGSASVELDRDGALVSYEEYHPYGTTAFQAGRSAAEVSLKRYRYTGKERDEESGLYYHGMRYYAPWLGRWTRPDPLYLKDATNVYIYALNNPVIAKDPTGGPAWLIPVAIYLGYRALESAAETGIETGIAKATGDEEFSVGGSFVKNMAVNTVIGVIPGAAEAKIGTKVATYTAKLAARTAGDTALDVAQGKDIQESLVKNAAGNVGGDLLGAAVKKGGSAVVKKLKGSADEVAEGTSKKVTQQAADEAAGASDKVAKEASVAPNTAGTATKAATKAVDQQLDANLISALINPKDVGHAAAVAYVNANKGAGLTVSRHTYQKFLSKYSKDQFKTLREKYGIKLLREIELPELAATASRLERAFAGTGRTLSAEDARVAATAFLRKEKLAT